MGTMPPFVGNYCEQQMAPPFQFDNVRIWGFPVQAAVGRVQEAVDGVFGSGTAEVVRGREGTPEAKSTLVYIVLLHYERMFPLGDSRVGAGTQRECYVGIVVRPKSSGRIALFCPYIFVDNPWSLVAGNTVLGYPKQMGSFQMGSALDHPFPIRLDAMVSPYPYAPLQWRLVLHIKEIPIPRLLETRPTSILGDIERLFGESGVLPVETDVLDLLRGTTISYDMMQLKQFRSAEQPSQACYRSIVTGTVTIDQDSFQPGSLFLPAAVHLPSYASSNIAHELGLEDTSELPFSLSCNFKLANLREEPWEPRTG